MAQLNRYDTTNGSGKKRAQPGLWQNVKKFFGVESDDRERPLNPTLVSSVSQGGEFLGPEEQSYDEHDERVHRIHERRRINESPATIWPG